MARAREFSVDIALDKAVQLFWQHGYANTSMRALVKHTGVAHAGLYTEFGSKEDLFTAALLKYQINIFNLLFSRLEAPNASLKDIKKLFKFISTANKNKYFKYGCFIANTSMEFAGKPGRVSDIVNHAYMRQLACFENALYNAVQQGHINKSIPIEQTACLLTTLFYGCANLARMQAPEETIQHAVYAALQNIEISFP